MRRSPPTGRLRDRGRDPKGPQEPEFGDHNLAISGDREQSRPLPGDDGEHAGGKDRDRYYQANIGKVTSIQDLLGNYRLLSYALQAYGLGDQIKSRR